jgi:G3E family GTPase
MLPLTIISGQLGAGKTTIILNLIKQLDKDHKYVWLKNEYGDVNIDTKLINESNIKTKEILNGCLCCVLIGRLKDAILEITKNYSPDRIIIETAGTAYPYPIIEEINKINSVFIDGFINIIDVLNFEKLSDKSSLAREQAKYFDLIIFNKWEEAENEQFNRVEDEVFEIYSNIPKIKSAKGVVDKELIFGLENKKKELDQSLLKLHHQHEDLDIFNLSYNNYLDKNKFEKIISKLNTADFYRIKGIIKLNETIYIFNYVLGRFTFEKVNKNITNSELVFMGARGILNLKDSIQKSLSGI